MILEVAGLWRPFYIPYLVSLFWRVVYHVTSTCWFVDKNISLMIHQVAEEPSALPRRHT